MVIIALWIEDCYGKILGPCISHSTSPRLQMGDFNTVRLSSERLLGFDSLAASEFNQCLSDICQDDLPIKGFWYTWTNKRGGAGDNKSKLE